MFDDNKLEAKVKVNGPGIKKDLPKYKAWTLGNFKKIPQLQNKLSQEELFEIEVVGTVLPFKANNYVVDELINWDNPQDDPIFRLTFPQKDMLEPHHYNKMAEALKGDFSKRQIDDIALEIRNNLNPNPAGQADYNLPVLEEETVEGSQHKYDQTVLFFPKQGQTCHAYCTFCFRWPQFVSTDDGKFAAKDISKIIDYIRNNPEVTDILFTGGDPMVMSGKIFETYIDEIIKADLPNLRNIRIGTKSLAYWPYTFLDDKNAPYILRAMRKAVKSGYHVAFMAHFNHHKELETKAVKEAIAIIQEQGVKIRSQSPIFNYINNDPEVWRKMWEAQVSLGVIPYYMFVARDTGAQHYFKVSLERAWQVFRTAYSKVSGLARTVRGPSMSCGPGKVQMLGVTEINGEKVMALRFIQGRNPDWVHRPFFAEYNPDAIWIDDLKPAFNEEKFFFEEELETIYSDKKELIDNLM